jgi:AbiV family abortive infection protein
VVTPDFLLKGTIFALHHCGRLLTDAVTLYRSGAHPSAVVLATFAREELGRSQILRQLRRDVLAGAALTVKDVTKSCRDHEEKLRAGQMSIVQRPEPGSELDTLIRMRMRYSPSSEEGRRAAARLEELTEQQRQATPGLRHRLRMAALYVQPDEVGTGWSRPSDRDREEVRQEIENAANDYRGQYDRMEFGSIELDDPEFHAALRAWGDRPVLPDPPTVPMS